MRLVFKISYGKANATSETSSGGDSQLRINSQVNVPRQYDNEFDSEKNNEMEDDQSKKLSDFHSYLYPMRDIIELDSNKVDQQSKRSENYANEVIKQEASVMHSNSNGGPKILLSQPSLNPSLTPLPTLSPLSFFSGAEVKIRSFYYITAYITLVPDKSLMHHDIQKNISYHNLYLFFPICK